MKALIISDKQEIIDFSSKFLKENGYDIIVYRWLLKAIDNIEEIQPDLIILSVAEYPRHWKILASFVKSGIGGKNVQIYLYDPDCLSDDEKRKAVELGIKDYITSLNTKIFEKIIPSIKNQNNNLTEITNNHLSETISQNNKNENIDKKIDNKEIDKSARIISRLDTQTDSCRFIFTNPLSNKFLFGTAFIEKQTKNLICILQDCSDLHPEMIIKYVSIYDQNNQISVFSAKILEIKIDDLDERQQKLIKIEPMEYYEKN